MKATVFWINLSVRAMYAEVLLRILPRLVLKSRWVWLLGIQGVVLVLPREVGMIPPRWVVSIRHYIFVVIPNIAA
ncbi:hypothetical protein V6N13_109498 [Hibiscus sabdariffa]